MDKEYRSEISDVQLIMYGVNLYLRMHYYSSAIARVHIFVHYSMFGYTITLPICIHTC